MVLGMKDLGLEMAARLSPHANVHPQNLWELEVGSWELTDSQVLGVDKCYFPQALVSAAMFPSTDVSPVPFA